MIKVTPEEKESMLQHCTEVKLILDKYPWFDSGPYKITSMNRCKSAVELLIEALECLECEDSHENN